MMDIFKWMLQTISSEINHTKGVEIKPTYKFADIGVDSIGLMTLFVHIEEHYGIEMDEDIMLNSDVETVADLCHYIEGKVAEDQLS